MTALSLNNRRRGIVSSGYIFSFWFLSLLLAILQFRHQIITFEDRPENSFGADHLEWVDYQFLSSMIYFPLILFQLCNHFIADRQPLETSYAKPVKSALPSPEPFSGFVQTIMFAWFDRMAWTGYRRALETSDIWDINPADTSVELVPIFDKHWEDNVKKNSGKKQSAKEEEKEKAFGKSTNVCRGVQFDFVDSINCINYIF